MWASRTVMGRSTTGFIITLMVKFWCPPDSTCHPFSAHHSCQLNVPEFQPKNTTINIPRETHSGDWGPGRVSPSRNSLRSSSCCTVEEPEMITGSSLKWEWLWLKIEMPTDINWPNGTNWHHQIWSKFGIVWVPIGAIQYPKVGSWEAGVPQQPCTSRWSWKTHKSYINPLPLSKTQDHHS